MDFLVASSFSKILRSITSGRGALTIVSPSAEESVVAMSREKKLFE